jgi:small nuclear ribonucleoprotein (snRNP)-like protein
LQGFDEYMNLVLDEAEEVSGAPATALSVTKPRAMCCHQL